MQPAERARDGTSAEQKRTKRHFDWKLAITLQLQTELNGAPSGPDYVGDVVTY